MPIGLQGAYGAAGAQDSIERILAQRIAERKYADQMRQQDIENSLRSRQLDESSALRRDSMAETKRQHDLADADRDANRSHQLVSELSPNQSIDAPTAGVLRSTGRAGLVQENPQPAGGDFVLPNSQEYQPGSQPGMIFTGTAGQRDQLADNDRSQRVYDANERNRANEMERQAKQLTETNRHNVAMENKQPPAATVVVQTVDENGQPVTKIVPKTAGATFAKGPNAVTANRLDSAQAVKQTGEDIITGLSDPKTAAMVGPAMGRYNTLRDFIGNPPPELAKIAGQIESYALANMGVHGMRSYQGSKDISSHLLDKHYDAQALIETIRGLNGFSEHFLQNAGRGGAKDSGGGGNVSMVAPDGRKLSVPANKVAELEAAGAKRQ